MKNKYLKKLSKIEFAVTDACCGRCKHCSQGMHKSYGERIDPLIAKDVVHKICSEYDIRTVMTFGGEPLLHLDAVYSIMNAANEENIEHRQLITSGYFTKDLGEISKVAKELFECGVNDLRLSVDAFHQEYIPIETVKAFAYEAKESGIPIRLQPAWLVRSEDDNPYNARTRELLDSFSDMGIFECEGNVIFSEGNALKYLSEYLEKTVIENPYVEDLYDVKCISFASNGDVLKSNVYKFDIIEIINSYKP